MDISGDELAGIVDLFGALYRPELEEAIAELAFKAGADPPDADMVQAAVTAYQLVEMDTTDGKLLAAGPTAFPALPDGAEDLPHILEIDPREVDRMALGRAVEERFRGEAARAVARGDDQRITELVDLSYDLEAWGPVDLARARQRLDTAKPTS